jgi:hypothetical protein
MRNFQKLCSGCAVVPLLLSIKEKSSLWEKDGVVRFYPLTPDNSADTITLRYPSTPVLTTDKELKEYYKTHDENECENREAWKLLPEARPLILELMKFVGGSRLGRVMINRLFPGSKSHLHYDGTGISNYFERFHIVLESNNKCLFWADGESVNMQSGEAWWFNHRAQHQVSNEGMEDRYHLIADIKIL